MKIKKFKKKKSFNKVYFLKNNLCHIDYKLKQVLKIISSFNCKKKKIWFLGFSSPKNYKTKHIFLSRCSYIKGLVSNEKFVKLNIDNNKSRYKINYIKPSLIVIYCLNQKSLLLLREFNKLNIPVLVIGSTLSKFSKTYCEKFRSFVF